jgi:serine phosphatase RsbU (regulator of sigma subunit)
VLEPKLFYRRLEALLDRNPAGVGRVFAERFVADLVEHLGDPLGVPAAALYERRDGVISRRRACGSAAPDLSAELARRLGPDGDIAELPWAGTTEGGPTGLFAIDVESRSIVALHFTPGEAWETARMVAVVSPLHYALAQHLRRRELEDVIDQARAIQVSLLPPSAPVFGDFDIAAVSIPARVVGGDLYDFLEIDDDTLGVAVADASGHGLPAALQARDVATGLRMGVERDLKVTRTVEKLNRVIHRSGLSTRFVSMAFGELERNGNLSYINAGHPPPLLLDEAGLHELTVGGTVLGPLADATYKLGFAHLDRGAVLALYTDGVIERGTELGTPFGEAGLTRWLTDWRQGPAAAAVENLVARLRATCDGAPFEDDVTIVFVRRPR